MKLNKITLLSLTILATILIGAFAFNALSAPPTLKLKVKWKPATYTLSDPVPNPWNAEVYFAPPRTFIDVVLDSFVLEGTYSCVAPAYPHPLKDRLIVPFDRDEVVEALLSKMPHMGPGIYIIYLEVSGQLIDGRLFSGRGSITFTYPEFPPP